MLPLLRWLSIVRLRVRSLLRRTRVEQDLDDEIRDHLERRIEDEMARGMTRVEARYTAMRAFGGVEQAKEGCRDMRHVTFIDHRTQDLRFAIRQLLRHPGFAFTAITVLTLGIAGSVAIFGFVDAGLIRPLPYRDPARVVTLFATLPESAPRQTRGAASYLNLVDWREWSTRNQSFESIAGYDVRAGFTMVTPAGPQRVAGLRVTSGFFRTLGVTPIIGREFADDEEGPTAPAATMLSYSAWQSRFGGSPDVLGQTVTLQSPWLAAAEPHVIVGVLPRDFHFTLAEHAEFWATIRGPQACWNVRTCQSLEVIARLAPGSTISSAAADATSMLAEMRRRYPNDHRDEAIAKIVPLREVMLGNVRPVLLMLLGGGALLLVIACVNVVSLLLARSDARARELGVRQALGASSSRVLAQFATEAMVLTAVGTVGGIVLSRWAISLLTGLLTADMISRMPYLQTAGLNGRVLTFAAIVSLGAAALFALVPAARVSMGAGASTLHHDARGFAGTHWRRFGAPLVVVELAVAMVLLAGAGLLSKSLYRLLTVDAGFNAQGLAVMSVTPVQLKDATGDAKDIRPGDLARRIAARVAALPGVQSTGYADQLPFGAGLAPASTFWVPGRAAADQFKESWPVRRVSAAYFQTLETRLVRGRYFTEEEVSAVAPVMIINQSAARRYFPDEDPIGRSIAFGSAASPQRVVVGVIGDIKDGPPETPVHPSAYVPFDNATFAMVVRMARADGTFYSTVGQAIREVAPDAMVGRAVTMRQRAERLPSTSLNRSIAWLTGGFAVIAFVLSNVGLYGVVAYSVGQRTREIGVRMALGAPRQSVYRLILGEASRIVVIGAALGAIGAVAAAVSLRRLLYDVQAWDPPTLAVAAAALVASALAASYIPARRAASVNPIEVLRGE
jgi:macrolide transport system ATP-binding/permease protein